MIVFPVFYLAPITYYAYLLKYSQEDIFFEVHEYFVKQSYRNRCEILAANGKLKLIIPITKPYGNKTLMKDIKISYAEEWQKNHWNSLKSAYGKSPFFEFYEPFFEPFYTEKIDNLCDYNFQLAKVILQLLNIEMSFQKTPEYANDNIKLDFRNNFSSKKPSFSIPKYEQVFSYKHAFHSNLSIIDLLFNKGPETILYLKKLSEKLPDKYEE